MAELILTDEEKALPFWNDLDDASLGRAIKAYGVKFLSSPRLNDECADAGMDMTLKAGTVGMACRAHSMGVEKWEIMLTGVTFAGEPIGDWQCTYELVRQNPVK
jgi:hypothetical protein